MALLDLLGRRWSMRILWELSNSKKPSSFRELQSYCDQVSSSVLSTRLNELKEANLIALDSDGYELTARGKELMTLIAPLRKWADKWGADLAD